MLTPACNPIAHPFTRARYHNSTYLPGQDTAGQTDSRTVGQSGYRPDLSPTWTRTAKTMLPHLTNQMAPPATSCRRD